MNRSRLTVLAALLLAGAASLLVGCAATSESADAGGESAVVERGRLDRELVLTGSLEAVNEQAVLVPREAAWRHPIRWMPVTPTAMIWSTSRMRST